MVTAMCRPTVRVFHRIRRYTAVYDRIRWYVFYTNYNSNYNPNYNYNYNHNYNHNFNNNINFIYMKDLRSFDL